MLPKHLDMALIVPDSEANNTSVFLSAGLSEALNRHHTDTLAKYGILSILEVCAVGPFPCCVLQENTKRFQRLPKAFRLLRAT
jgi:hypothetical protein